MMVPTAEIKFPMRIFSRLPSIMPNEAIIMHPSHEANRKTEAIIETVLTFGIYEDMLVTDLV